MACRRGRSKESISRGPSRAEEAGSKEWAEPSGRSQVGGAEWTESTGLIRVDRGT